ncbi:tryptophan 2,3-dioxygenase [Amycolatopsis pithecellobii]|uniref:Tryptophan 2,3-dioxygenase n=1 Tax=Amycolatopsis pithecellobii TaxID=664692 RepID=A0A6N7Z388_9PSEU|nr:tryptophan 2,3-dioxygenase family protein [Amycolatopsis pithecellobii]MTD53336.1 tryptophan 2,3-dioxygenase [Amycolatopsis pithecellobii]
MTELSSDEQRRRLAEQTGGQPWLDFPPGKTPYVDYARMDVLLSLQKPRTGAALEYRFIVISQVKELLFDLLYTELSRAREHLRDAMITPATELIRRTTSVLHLLISCWDALGELNTAEFAEFRDHLGAASGFQSFSYRKLEFLLGNKNPEMVRPHRRAPWYPEVARELTTPSLYDEVIRLLAKSAGSIPAPVSDRDPATLYHPEPAVEQAWLEVYRDPAAHRELYELGEVLTEVSSLFARWRSTHLLTVERIIGSKPGSGGTSGVTWLRSITGHRFFPELWSMRTSL